MMHTDDDDTDEEVAEIYGWQEGEREAMQREMAEQQARAKRDETLEWCRRRNLEVPSKSKSDGPTDELGRPLNDPRNKFNPDEVVTKGYGMPATQAAPTLLTKEWQAYIERRIDTHNIAMIKAVADAVVTEEKARQQIDTDLIARVAKLETELTELRAEAKVRAALEDMATRLDKLETVPASRLKVAG